MPAVVCKYYTLGISSEEGIQHSNAAHQAQLRRSFYLFIFKIKPCRSHIVDDSPHALWIKGGGDNQHTQYDFHTFPFAHCGSGTVKHRNIDRVETILKSHLAFKYVYVKYVSIYCYGGRQYSYCPLKFFKYSQSTETHSFLPTKNNYIFCPIALPSPSVSLEFIIYLFSNGTKVCRCDIWRLCSCSSFNRLVWAREQYKGSCLPCLLIRHCLNMTSPSHGSSFCLSNIGHG